MTDISKNAELQQSCITAVMPCFSSLWNETAKLLPNANQSCLAIRKGTDLCNLYLNINGKWKNDGYSSDSERVFDDVTHWILLSDVPLPK